MQLQFCRHAKCVYESVLILRRDCGKKYRVNNQHRFATMPPIYGVSCFKYCTSAFDKLSTLFSQHFSNTLVKQASNKLIKCLSNTLTNKYTVQIFKPPTHRLHRKSELMYRVLEAGICRSLAEDVR